MGLPFQFSGLTFRVNEEAILQSWVDQKVSDEVGLDGIDIGPPPFNLIKS